MYHKDVIVLGVKVVLLTEKKEPPGRLFLENETVYLFNV